MLVFLLLLLVFLALGYLFREEIAFWLFGLCRGVCRNPHGARDIFVWLTDGLSC